MISVMLLGASGLTGQALLSRLILDSNIREIILLVRRTLSVNSPKVKQYQPDFSRLQDYQQLFKVDQIFCCLGTTIKTAGSKAAFRAIDVDLVSQCGQLAVTGGVDTFIVISAVGANQHSGNFYSRCKGDMEAQLIKISKESTMKIIVCRPSLLLGNRAIFRLAESTSALLTKLLPFLFHGPLKQYSPIRATQLADAMLSAAREATQEQIRVISSPDLITLSDK